MGTFKEIWLEIDIKNIFTQALDRVLEGKDVDTPAILDIEARAHANKITYLDTEIITDNPIYLDVTFRSLLGTQTNEDRVPSHLPTGVKDYRRS